MSRARELEEWRWVIAELVTRGWRGLPPAAVVREQVRLALAQGIMTRRQADLILQEYGLSDVRTNPGSTPSRRSQGILLGHLVSMEVRQGARTGTVRGGALYVGWIPSSKTLCLIRKTRQATTRNPISRGVLSLHRRFHNADAQRATTFEWPDPVGKKRPLGRIVALTYKIPKGMKSPQKGRYLWKHEFGDHGERGHGPVRGSGHYPEKLMPLLQVDQAGNMFIKRMPGNRYYVTDWLYW